MTFVSQSALDTLKNILVSPTLVAHATRTGIKIKANDFFFKNAVCSYLRGT